MGVKTFLGSANHTSQNKVAYRSTRYTLKKIVTYTLALMVILCHSVYYYMDISRTVLQIGILFVTFSFFACATQGKVNRNCCVGMLGIVSVVAMLFCIGWIGDDVVSFVSRYVLFVPLMTIAFLKINREEYNGLFIALSDWICLIALVSLFFWTFATVLDIIPRSGFVRPTWSGIKLEDGTKGAINFYYVYFETQIPPESLREIFRARNCGVFCEGPAYAFVLSCSLMIEMFYKNGRNRKRIIIIITTIVTTLATSAIVYIVLAFALKWLLSMSRRMGAKRKLLLLPYVGVMFVYMIIILLKYKSNQASVGIRTQDLLNGFEALFRKPLLGHGYSFATETLNAGITSSLSDTMVRGGLLMTFFYIMPILLVVIKMVLLYYKCGHETSLESRAKMALGTWVLYAYVTTILTYTFFLLTFVAYFYSLLLEGEKRNGIGNKSAVI